MKAALLSLSCLLLGGRVAAFSAVSPPRAAAVRRSPSSPSASALSSTTAEGDVAAVATAEREKLLDRDRYVATNRFTVRPGRGPKFEKRWADRSSRLASLDGFRYFHLMRRVSLDGEENSGVDPLAETDPFGNYVSFTIWKEKKHFNAWRRGDAFREAHGGTSLFAFVTTMVKSAMVLKGAPKPAFYDGLLQQTAVPDAVPETVDGWRSVEADGVEVLPAECFVAMNQFFVPGETAAGFEERWRDRTSKLKECDGFVSFTMLRRDARAKGHGVAPVGEEEPTYASCTIWRDRAAFEGWRTGAAFKDAHGDKKEEGEGGEEGKKQPPAPMWSRPPVPVFYEGTLVISSPEGA